jgi:hypothetical protein
VADGKGKERPSVSRRRTLHLGSRTDERQSRKLQPLKPVVGARRLKDVSSNVSKARASLLSREWHFNVAATTAAAAFRAGTVLAVTELSLTLWEPTNRRKHSPGTVLTQQQHWDVLAWQPVAWRCEQNQIPKRRVYQIYLRQRTTFCTCNSSLVANVRHAWTNWCAAARSAEEKWNRVLTLVARNVNRSMVASMVESVGV